MLDLLLSGCNPLIADIRITNAAVGFAHITHVEARLKSGARVVMKQLCSNADYLGLNLTLNACPIRTPLYPEMIELDKLISWYQSFGFKRIPASTFITNPMVRYYKNA